MRALGSILGSRPLVAALAAGATWLAAGPDPLTPAQRLALDAISFHLEPDGQGGFVRTIRLTGVNLQLVNGLGATETTNGTGNLVVGYNEFGNQHGDDRRGSHNLVVGRANSFKRYGGLVVAEDNTLSGPYAAISGGSHHLATGSGASIGGGFRNLASGTFSAVQGGDDNVASGYASAILGGGNNSAPGQNSAVGGGFVNQALGVETWIGGGLSNRASGLRTAVSGGSDNLADGNASTLGGGFGRAVTGDFDWGAGGLFEEQ